MASGLAFLIRLGEKSLLPDALLRAGCRRLIRMRLQELNATDVEHGAMLAEQFAAALQDAPVAVHPAAANDQHYEIPPDFFAHILGRHMKYSSAYWPEGVNTLDEAEAAALAATCEHAGLRDGQRLLELGCGWGSLSLWAAERYPGSTVVAVSNSSSQREHIEREAKKRQLSNLRVITADMNRFDITERFDRVISVEMFEHMRNWPELFRRIHGWLEPEGRLLIHVFTHRAVPYTFEPRDASDWMSRFFFSGGMMPADDLPLRFQAHLRFIRRWRWSGQHYEKTANAWLERMDAERVHLQPVLQHTYGEARAELWRMRWRIFFMAVAELFGHERGSEWYVGHYLFERPGSEKP